MSAGYKLVGLIAILPFTDIVSAPGWLDIDGNWACQEVTSVQGFSNKGALQRNCAILLARKGSGSMSVLPPEAPLFKRIDEIQGFHFHPRRCFGGEV